MKRTKLLIAFTLAGFTFASCESQRSTSVSESPATTTNVTTDTGTNPEISGESEMEESMTAGPFVSDADFVAKAAQMGMTVVKFSKLAEKMAVSPAVKDFAVEMQEEHSRANSLLMQMAHDKKWQTPEEMDAMHQEVYKDLLTVISDKFDRQYMEQMVKDHQMAVALFRQASGSVSDPQLREYVNQTTPALQDHLTMAQNVLRNLNTNK